MSEKKNKHIQKHLQILQKSEEDTEVITEPLSTSFKTARHGFKQNGGIFDLRLATLALLETVQWVRFVLEHVTDRSHIFVSQRK